MKLLWLRWVRRYLHVFRALVVVVCGVVGMVGVVVENWTLVAICACVGLGEVVECTYYLSVLEWGRRTGRL
jgi:hypothetical protein